MTGAKDRAAARRVRARAADALARAVGDPAEAVRLLWARSRHDSAFREDLVRFACSLIVHSLSDGASPRDRRR